MSTRTLGLQRRCAAFVVAALLAAGCGGDSPEALVASARDYLAKSDRNAAVIQLKNALQKDPRHAEARLLLGRAQFDLGDYMAAEKDLRRAVEYGRSAEEVAPVLAGTMLALGQYREVVKEFAGQKAATPAGEADLRTAVGRAQLRLGDAQAAGASFDAALAVDPAHARAKLGRAALAAAAGRTEEAIRGADAVIAAAPRLGDAWMLRAHLATAAGNAAEARSVLERALAADAGNVEARAALVTMLIEDKAFDDAAQRLQEGRKAVRGGELRFAFLEGLLAQRRGDRVVARERVQQVLRAAPNHVPSLLLAATLDLAENLPASSEANLRKVLAQLPEHQGARRLLVTTLLRAGQSQQALDALQPLLAGGDRPDATLAMLAGETFLANGDARQASVFYAQAAGAEAQKVAARTRLGQIALASGRTEAGMKELEEAAELDPGQYQADLALISAHLRKNEVAKAQAAAEALARKQPDNPLSHQMLGVTAVARKDVVAARAAFERAVQINAGYLPAVTALANLDLARKDPEAARRRYEDAITRTPKVEAPYLALAQLQARTGMAPEAVAATLERAVKAAPPAVEARMALVSLALRRGDRSAALAAAQSAVAALPEEPRLLVTLAQAQDASGQYNQAAETLHKVIALQPKSSQPLQLLAALHARNKQPARAIDAQQRAQLLLPDNPAVVGGLVGLLQQAGRYDEALKEAVALQRRQPRRAEGFALEGNVLLAQRNWATAEKAFAEALKRDPRAEALAPRLHLALDGAGKGAEAAEFARKWLAEHPRDPGMRMYLGDRALQQRNLKAAQAMYGEVLALDPNNALALNNLAWIGGELGDARALGYAERAAALAPGNPSVLDTLGMLQLAKGDAAKALETLERARQLDATRPTLRLNYAKALLKAGRKDAARTELEALQQLPEDFTGKAEIAGLLKST